METEDLLKGKKILAVDDEQDILDTLLELLDMCNVDTADSFEKAKELLERNYYDIAILDIMGVKGYDLLEIAKNRNIPALMLTAHALTEEDLKRSIKEGASYFVPKDEIDKIHLFIQDVLEAKDKKRNVWLKWYERLASFWDRRFGERWREKDKEFWDSLIKY